MERSNIDFIKFNLYEMLKAKSVDEVVGMTKILVNYIERIYPVPVRLYLKESNQRKIEAIKSIRNVLGIGLKEAKELSERPDRRILDTEDINLAMKLHKELINNGVEVLLEGSDAVKILFGGRQ